MKIKSRPSKRGPSVAMRNAIKQLDKAADKKAVRV